ncbi:hypothetical protein SEA_WHYTU_14 [Arthrobacter phage Whytu]|uniref:Uncharacterized protein n=1 Tax=Arthrobacter phage Whytu TaxID=2713260 RepID=A0A6G8R2T1_9CAUD|nr:hypothetical protein QEX69_gp14 [Arthrobacter phage Whytu]QIN94483.1 hypothetical protein SEA_WHYTU_14 [Arthrobacter phage Whytu]
MTPPTDEITTGELGRRLDAFGTTIQDGFKELGKKIDDRPDWQDVRRIESGLVERIQAETKAREVAQRVADRAILALEDGRKWVSRSIIGAVGLGVINLIWNR